MKARTECNQPEATSNMPDSVRRSLLGAFGASLAGAGLGFPSVSRAQGAYPSKPIRMVIPWPPGQATDLVGRSLAVGLSRVLGQAIVADNKAGAGGMIGCDAAAKAKPDGYTILAASSGPLTVIPLVQTTPYDAQKDFTYIAMACITPYVLVTASDFPAKDAAALVALVKANPGKYNFGSSGTGATGHLMGEAFHAAAGLSVVHVPFKGTLPALTEVMAGRVAYCFETASVIMPFIRDGRLRGLGCTLLNGSAVTPGIPPLSTAANVPGFNLGGWIGLAAPAGLTAEVRERLAKATKEVLQSAETKELFEQIFIEVDFKQGAEFTEYLSKTSAVYAEVIRKNNIKLES
ncbi:tripartite-type tricarboxylate transporter receptor subunit TctC [Jezberella montanilacus]|uniref:Tripartite-type tricarboxylate transporter receptor subunit TctC n=1 Tax=Jezberella montanilacus TaxID=323426 RepID=A0A2T0XD68_9BURK|nr:tripartite tricarboxylate transporter substrate binding protein [Jezberella montanilacus]PRY96884.1 tripartite-type tricarboxylate transporter receptor subunit TctC [Jezberella montanilacus]